MSNYESPLSQLFSKEQHRRFARITGAYMLSVIQDSSIARVNRRSLEVHCGFEPAIDRWGAALRYLSWPRQDIPGLEDLTEEEVFRLDTVSKKRGGLAELTKKVKNDKSLREPLRGFHDFPKTNANHVDVLLNNGVIDTAEWLRLMTQSGVEAESISDHPLFLVATSFNSPGHHALSGALWQRFYAGDRRIPATRAEAVEAIEGVSPEIMSKALASRGIINTSGLTERGFCPAGTMRDEQGNAWVHLLVKQGLELVTEIG